MNNGYEGTIYPTSRFYTIYADSLEELTAKLNEEVFDTYRVMYVGLSYVVNPAFCAVIDRYLQVVMTPDMIVPNEFLDSITVENDEPEEDNQTPPNTAKVVSSA